MSFWIGATLENFLFKGLHINSNEGLTAVLVVVLICSASYEGLRTFRDYLMHRFIRKQKKNSSSFSNNGHDNVIQQQQSSRIDVKFISEKKKSETKTRTNTIEFIETGNNQVSSFRKISKSKRFMFLFFATLVHMIQICVGYTLMLAVMTFNAWIFIAVTLGTVCGYFIFDCIRRKFSQL